MTTTNGGAAQATDGGAQANAAQPQLNVLAQYVKDLSFENPNAPRSLQQQQQAPQINIQINVNAKPMSGTEYEVELKIEGRAEVASTLLFAFDLLYAGVFRIQNVPQDSLHAVIMIECPRLLVPVRARADRDRGAQWRLPAADDRSGGFRRALPPEARRAAAPAGPAGSVGPQGGQKAPAPASGNRKAARAPLPAATPRWRAQACPPYAPRPLTRDFRRQLRAGSRQSLPTRARATRRDNPSTPPCRRASRRTPGARRVPRR